MATNINTGTFKDTRAILVRGHDARCASYWDEASAGFEQDEDGPTYLIIGCLASDERLQKLAARYPQFSLQELVAFRDAPASIQN